MAGKTKEMSQNKQLLLLKKYIQYWSSSKNRFCTF